MQQLEFNFEADENNASLNPKRRESNNEHIKDNDKIKDAEKRFKNGDRDALVELYKVVCCLADKYIHSESKKKRFYIERDQVLEKCNNVGVYILEQYLSRPDFELKTPSAYIWLRVMRELYHRDWTAKHIVFTDSL